MNQTMDIDQIYTPPTPPPTRMATPNAPQRPRNLRVDIPEQNNPRAHPIFQLLLDNNNQ